MTDLQELNALAHRLTAAADDASRMLREFEARLHDLSLEVEAWVTRPPLAETTARGRIPGVEEAESRSHQRDELGYARHEGGWRLLVRTRTFVDRQDRDGFDVYESPADRLPLAQAERWLRLKAVTMLPALLDELRTQAAQLIDSIQNASQA